MLVSWFTEQPMSAYPEEQALVEHPDDHPALRSGDTVLLFSNRYFDAAEGSRLYRERIAEFVHAEEVGFDAVMVNEHHYGAFCMNARCNIMTAALAVATHRVKLLQLGNPLPLWSNPIQLAEEIAMLDMISGGRLVSGIVRGGGQEQLAMNVNPAFNREMFDEAHELLIRIWTEPGPFAFEGDHYQFRVVNPWALPLQKPHPRIFVPGVVSKETVVWAAEHGYPYVALGTTIEQTKQIWALYDSTAKSVGYTAGPEHRGYLLRCHVSADHDRAMRNARQYSWMRGEFTGVGNPIWSAPAGYSSWGVAQGTAQAPGHPQRPVRGTAGARHHRRGHPRRGRAAARAHPRRAAGGHADPVGGRRARRPHRHPGVHRPDGRARAARRPRQGGRARAPGPLRGGLARRRRPALGPAAGRRARPRGTMTSFDELRRAAERAVEQDGEIGLQVAVVVDGVVAAEIAVGTADQTSGAPVDDRSLFPVFSATKGVVAAAAAAALAAGDVHLDEPVQTVWPGLRHGITLHHLLTHTAGLPLVPTGTDVARMCDWEAMVTAMEAETPLWGPGSAVGYHAYTYGWLVGETLRRAAGERHEDAGTVIRRLACLPAGTDDFWLGLPDSEHHRVVTLYRHGARSAEGPLRRGAIPADLDTGQEVFGRPEVRRAVLPGAGGIGTARSLALVYDRLACLASDAVATPEPDRGALGRQLLESTAVCEERTDIVLGTPVPRGLGFYVSGSVRSPQEAPLEGPHGRFGHPGAGGSIAWGDQELRAGFAVLRNRMTPLGWNDPVVRRLATAASDAVRSLRSERSVVAGPG